MNYTEMLFNRDERLVNLLNQADSKNLELIEEINKKEDEIDRLNNILDEYRNHLIKKMNEFVTYDGDLSKIYEEEFDYFDKLKELKENNNE